MVIFSSWSDNHPNVEVVTRINDILRSLQQVGCDMPTNPYSLGGCHGSC